MPTYRVVKQFITGSANQPAWAKNDTYIAQLSGSDDKLWEYDTQFEAMAKMYELSGSDSTKRLYKVIEV